MEPVKPTVDACIMCDLGWNMSDYHRLRHMSNPKAVCAFHDKLMNEPIGEFSNAPFDEDLFDSPFFDSDESMDFILEEFDTSGESNDEDTNDDLDMTEL